MSNVFDSCQRHNRQSKALSLVHEPQKGFRSHSPEVASSRAHAKLKLRLPPSYFVPRDLCHYTFPFVNQFSPLSISCFGYIEHAIGSYFYSTELVFHLIKFRSTSQKFAFSLLLFIFHRARQEFRFLFSGRKISFLSLLFLARASEWWKRYTSMANRLNLSIGSWWSVIVSRRESWISRRKSSRRPGLIREVRKVSVKW